MTEVKTEDTPIFEASDTIRIELEVTDNSGVSEVGARFRVASGSHYPKSIYKAVELDGETNATVVIEFHVGDELPPGDYTCEYISLTDQKGNNSLFVNPGIEFKVEGTSEDQEGPVLEGWRFARLPGASTS